MEVHDVAQLSQRLGRARWFCVMYQRDNLLVKRVDVFARTFYRCVRFDKLSPSLAHISWSDEKAEFDLTLCNEARLTLDLWPLVRYDILESDRRPCPFQGGWDVKMADSEMGENPCNHMWRPMRLDVDCLGGEGVTLDFIGSHCLNNITDQVKQRSVCVASWQDDTGLRYVILRKFDRLDLWCLVVPVKFKSSHVTARVYLSPACPTGGREEELAEKSVRFLTLHLRRRVFASLCEDEHQRCSSYPKPCAFHVRRECQKSCGVCNYRDPDNFCSFDPLIQRGQWLLNDKLGQFSVQVEESTFSVGGVGSFQCLEAENSSRNSPRKYVTTSLYENGCRPRFTCLKLQLLLPSVLWYSLGETHPWPLSDPDDVSEICSDRYFSDRQLNHGGQLYHSGPGSVKHVVYDSPSTPVPCGLRSVYSVHAVTSGGRECKGQLSQHCRVSSRLRLHLDPCDPGGSSTSDFRCLVKSRHVTREFTIVQNVHDQRDVLCLTFDDLSPGHAYLLPAGQCNENGVMAASSEILKAKIKLGFIAAESEVCGYFPLVNESEREVPQESGQDTGWELLDFVNTTRQNGGISNTNNAYYKLHSLQTSTLYNIQTNNNNKNIISLDDQHGVDVEDTPGSNKLDTYAETVSSRADNVKYKGEVRSTSKMAEDIGRSGLDRSTDTAGDRSSSNDRQDRGGMYVERSTDNTGVVSTSHDREDTGGIGAETNSAVTNTQVLSLLVVMFFICFTYMSVVNVFIEIEMYS